jgi:hypothetical protein
MSPQRYMFMRLVYMLAPCRLLFIADVSSCAVADHRITHSRTPVLHSYWSLSMPLDCSFLCVPRLPVMHLFQLDFKIMPAHRTCVTSVQPGASETSAVRRAVVRHNFASRVATRLLYLFLPGYFVFQVKCDRSILFFPFSYNQFAIGFHLPLCRFNRGGTPFLGFYNPLVLAAPFNPSIIRRSIALYVSPDSTMFF